MRWISLCRESFFSGPVCGSPELLQPCRRLGGEKWDLAQNPGTRAPDPSLSPSSMGEAARALLSASPPLGHGLTSGLNAPGRAMPAQTWKHHRGRCCAPRRGGEEPWGMGVPSSICAAQLLCPLLWKQREKLILATARATSWRHRGGHLDSGFGSSFPSLPEPLCFGHQLLPVLCKRCYLFTSSLCACLASHQRDLFSTLASI